MNELAGLCYLFTPLLLGLVAHGFTIKFNLFPFLSRPVDQGRSFRGLRIFGANKTYRGIVVISLATGLGFYLQAIVLHRIPTVQHIELFDYSPAKSLFLGLAVGLAAMLSELPNSFIKRQLDIAPGASARGLKIALFYTLDQIDFLFGSWLVLSLEVHVTAGRLIWSAVLIFISHQILTSFGYLLGMRSTPY
jgi:CDP-archaeol synthase